MRDRHTHTGVIQQRNTVANHSTLNGVCWLSASYCPTGRPDRDEASFHGRTSSHSQPAGSGSHTCRTLLPWNRVLRTSSKKETHYFFPSCCHRSVRCQATVTMASRASVSAELSSPRRW
ncbi:hypothetical protein E2C01_061201 [Portunus trituberculatus]|uniref:Uncharacterized protein n=1 Tax=Portunus trituberculatus TaxID=210409 RepID=A0A5B7H387_PORTR|nr:hypothetical protein [Portunus trituberculatus]